MSSVDYTNQILDAVETITNRVIETAGYNKTIQATILQKLDANGKYKAKYQDSELIVYANNLDIEYLNGTLVYVLIPNGDFNSNKIILDTVDKTQANYTTSLNEEDNFIDICGNAISSAQEFGLCSYKQAGENDEFDDQYILYDRDTGIDNINLNTLLVKDNLFKADNILCGAQFKTNLKPAQQMQGNYGLIFEIDFKNNIDEELVTKRYILDINSMIGQPYNLTTYTRQYKTFNINTNNFHSVKRIFIFSDGFPNSLADQPNDIFIQAFELNLIKEITDDNYIVYIDKDKQYFDAADPAQSVINLTAAIKLKNKTITDSAIEFYWFKENSSINVGNNKYLSYGGNGWECLNNYTDNGTTREYISNNNLAFTIEQAPTLDNKIKCVAVRNGLVFAVNEDNIKNYASSYSLTIESNEGTEFYYDNGNPTLTCLINGAEDITNYDYLWSYIDNNNIYHLLNETTDLNTEYNNALNAYKNLETRVETGLANATASQEMLSSYLAIISSGIQRVEKNKIHNIDLTQIYEKSTFKCTVVDKITNDVIGTGFIDITNEMTTKGTYLLEITNGFQTFHYNENGLAPTHESLDEPIVLKPLGFNIYDSQGKQFSQKILDNCDVVWKIPEIDTLISSSDNITNHSLTYTIANLYDEKKLFNNNIGLTVRYKNLVLKSSTSFTFTKEGDPSYNGSNIMVKIVPNIDSLGSINCYPMVVNGLFNFGVLNYTNISNTKWFKIQIWKEGNKVYEGNTNTNGVTNLKWSILKNKYNTSISDPTNITIDNNGNFAWDGNISGTVANIVKVSFTYENKIYHSAVPVISVSSLATDYTIALKQNTGFRNVMYESDNTHPHYSNNIPFTIEVKKVINGYVEDISTVDNNNTVTYTWNALGKIYNGSNFVDSKDFTISNISSNLANNQKILKPNDKYSGEVVTNALQVEIRNNSNNNLIGTIHIPLYFYLNKFGYAALDDWNGNSIELKQNGGYILSPQFGAGSVGVNGFTGLLMGKIRDANSASGSEKNGLMGLKDGDQTIFLSAEDGSASFGKSGSGQIVIDATSSKIYGGNYQNNNSQGMLIDLNTPEIKYGNGNFTVNSSGKLTAKGVDIDGEINATSGTFGGGTNKITIGKNGTNNVNSAIYSGSKSTLTSANNGFYIGTDGISLGTYDNTNGNPFQVTTAGVLSARGATINGTLSAGSGSTIGPWNVTNTSIWYGNQNYGNASGLYWGTSGLSLTDKFKVSSSGELTAKSGYIGNGSNGWTIANTALYNGKSSLTASSNGVYIGTDGISLGTGSTFKVTNAGALSATSGSIAGWNIGNNALYTSSNNLYLGNSGITATIGGTSRSNIVFKAGSNFGVNSSGDLFCNNATINGNMVTSDGVLTYMSVDGLNCLNEAGQDGNYAWNFLGFLVEENETQTAYRAYYTYFEFKITIPENYEVEEARIVCCHNPITWSFESGNDLIGCSKDLKVYKVTLNANIGAAYMSEFFYDDVSTESEVSAAGIVTNFSTSGAQTKSTNNFASIFKNSNNKTVSGTYVFRLRSAAQRPEDQSISGYNLLCRESAEKTGWCEASLEIIGHKKLS